MSCTLTIIVDEVHAFNLSTEYNSQISMNWRSTIMAWWKPISKIKQNKTHKQTKTFLVKFSERYLQFLHAHLFVWDSMYCAARLVLNSQSWHHCFQSAEVTGLATRLRMIQFVISTYFFQISKLCIRECIKAPCSTLPHPLTETESENEFRPLDERIDEFHPKATRTLFIGNLEKTTTYHDLRNIFQRFGEIVVCFFSDQML